jgi:hypothetical protein
MKSWKIKQVLSRTGYWWEGGQQKERVKESRIGGYIFYCCVKIEPVEIVL